MVIILDKNHINSITITCICINAMNKQWNTQQRKYCILTGQKTGLNELSAAVLLFTNGPNHSLETQTDKNNNLREQIATDTVF